MFIITQDGEHTVNMDEVEEILTEHSNNEVILKTKSGNRILAAKYPHKGRKALGKDMATLLRDYEYDKKVFMFSEEGGSDE